MSSAAVVIGAIRVNTVLLVFCYCNTLYRKYTVPKHCNNPNSHPGVWGNGVAFYKIVGGWVILSIKSSKLVTAKYFQLDVLRGMDIIFR